jgi:hypothetical protein
MSTMTMTMTTRQSPVPVLSTIVLLPLLLFSTSINIHIPTTQAYCTGYLRNRDIAGIWRLTRTKTRSTGTQSFLPKIPNKESYPLKEFTVYPKKKNPQPQQVQQEQQDQQQQVEENATKEDILLLLKEDGKFEQYTTSTSANSANRSKSSTSNRRKHDPNSSSSSSSSTATEKEASTASMKGSWGLVDGKLILATDRPNLKDGNHIGNEEGTSIGKGKGNSQGGGMDIDMNHDTILEGRVVAVSDDILVDNPALMGSRARNQKKEQQQKQQRQPSEKGMDQTNDSTTSNTSSTTTNNNDDKPNTEDVHLSVPKGQVKIGKFFYPKNHPSFFEQPMFQSTSTGSFELRQILGSLNTQMSDYEEEYNMVEKFRKKDLMDKRYFITSYPLRTGKKKRQRWSIKYNKYVGKIYTCILSVDM